MAMEIRLPEEKLRKLQELLLSWRGRRSGQGKELKSLVGMLQHAATVVRLGRIFLHRLYNLLTQTSHFKPHYSVRLASEPQADIKWRCTFIRSWNGSSILWLVRTERTDMEVWSDASGGWGCGAHWRSL